MRSHAPRHRAHDPQRNNPRYAAQLRARFGIHGLDHEAPVANISERGMCLRTSNVYKTGSRILIALDLPSGQVHLRGEVMWAIRVPKHQTEIMEHGMGVQFLDVGPEWQKAFDAWKAEHL